MSERDILNAVSTLASGNRTAFLDHACAGDAELRRRVEDLLGQSDDAGSFREPATCLAHDAE